MIEDKSFLDELLEEAESKEGMQTEAYYDLVLLQIKTLTLQIEKNFTQAEKECELINNWALTRNSMLTERVRILELKLKAFILETKEKTIDLPNGILKMHKKPDKVEITDIELFLKNAKPNMLTIVPESVKPDINKIKASIKTKPIPAGVTVTEGKEEFTYKLKGLNDAREEETGTRAEQTHQLRAVV